MTHLFFRPMANYWSTDCYWFSKVMLVGLGEKAVKVANQTRAKQFATSAGLATIDWKADPIRQPTRWQWENRRARERVVESSCQLDHWAAWSPGQNGRPVGKWPNRVELRPRCRHRFSVSTNLPSPIGLGLIQSVIPIRSTSSSLTLIPPDRLQKYNLRF